MPPTPEELENLYNAGVVPRPEADLFGRTPDEVSAAARRMATAGQQRMTPFANADQMGPPDSLAPDAPVPPPTGGPGGGGAYPGDYGGPAGTPPRIGTLTNKETDTTTTNAPLTPEEADLDRKRLSSTEDRQHDAIEKQKIAMRNKKYQLGFQMLEQTLKKKEHEAQSEWLKADYEKVKTHFSEARASFAKMKIDPDRFIKGMSGTQHVLSTIADAMATLAEGLTRGRIKNNTGKMLQMAIDRDIAAQRSDMATKLQGLKLSRGQMISARKAWREREKDLRVAGLDLATMHLSAAAAQTKDMATLNVMRKSLDDIKKEKIRVGGLARPKVVEKVKIKKRQAVIKGTGGYVDPSKLKSLPDAVKANLVDSASTMDMLDRLGKRLRAGKGLSAGGLVKMKLWWTKAKFNQAQKHALALKISAQWNRGKPTDKDTNIVKPLIPGPGDTTEMAGIKLNQLVAMGRYRMRKIASMYPSNRWDTRPLRRLIAEGQRGHTRSQSLSRLRKKSKKPGTP